MRLLLRPVKKSVLSYIWRIKSKRYYSQYGNSFDKLHLGAGYTAIDGWLNTDVNYSGAQDIYFLDATTKFPFNDSSYRFVYSEHMIEHLTLEDAHRMLNESYRVMKPGATIRIVTPDLQFITSMLHQNNEDVEYYKKEFGNKFFNEQSKVHAEQIINKIFYSWGHKHIYTFTTLSELLLSIGFGNIKRYNVHESSLPEFAKIEQHPNIVGYRFNNIESLCVEAQK